MGSSGSPEGSNSPEECRTQRPPLQPEQRSKSPIIPLLEISPINKEASSITIQSTTTPRFTDLSVKSVLLSEFTSSEKVKYIERSNSKNNNNNNNNNNGMVLNRQEFCINI